MKCKEIIEILEQKYAPSFAESWDNVGLLAGDREREVKKIFLALDVIVFVHFFIFLAAGSWA